MWWDKKEEKNGCQGKKLFLRETTREKLIFCGGYVMGVLIFLLVLFVLFSGGHRCHHHMFFGPFCGPRIGRGPGFGPGPHHGPGFGPGPHHGPGGPHRW